MKVKKYRATSVVRTEPENLEREELIRKAAGGDEAAFEAYYKQNINLVRKIVNRCHRQWPRVDADNIHQEALMGLLRGIKKYKAEKRKVGKPETYLFDWVYAYARQYCVNAGKDEVGKVTYIDEVSDKYSVNNNDESMECYDEFEIYEVLERFFGTLNPLEKTVARGRFVYDAQRTLKSLGDELGITRERVRQISRRLIPKFKRFAMRHDFDLHWAE